MIKFSTGIVCLSFITTFSIGSSNGQLHFNQHKEGNCINMDNVLADHVDLKFLGETRMWFVPVANKYTFREYAEALLGRVAIDYQELSQMCLRILTEGHTVITYGFNFRTIEQSCQPTPASSLFNSGQVQIKCDIVKPSPRFKPSFFKNYEDNIVMTDNQTYILLVSCVYDIKNYKVLSTTPSISDEIYSKIEQKIISLGFDISRLQTLGCRDAK